MLVALDKHVASSSTSKTRSTLVRILFFTVFAAVRFTCLSMDPPSWLSWSAGLYTDEGFYSLDARHQVLFHHAAPGNFHDSLLSPGLSAVQQIVFGVFGPSDLCARALSVVLSLATILLLWLALRRSCGEDAADIGACFLGLSPAAVFYNRMALQETPAVLFLVASLCARSYADEKSTTAKSLALEFACGVLAASVVLFKPLGLLALPALIMLGRTRGQRLQVLVSALGTLAVLLLWFVLHYLPNHSELARMGQYYRLHQTLPATPRTLWLDIRRGFISTRSGLFPFLLSTSPVVFGLALYNVWVGKTVKSPVNTVLLGWLLCGILYCMLMVYSPSRYYVLFLPALAGVAAIACSRCAPALRIGLVALFCLVSVGWIFISFSQRAYTMAAARLSMAHLLPSNGLLVGDVAPSLCMDSQIQAAPMQPGLSNDNHPLEKLNPDAIVLIRSKTWDDWWTDHYPGILDPSQKLAGWTVGPGYRIEVFRVRRGETF